jgi:hypothetical protein
LSYESRKLLVSSLTLSHVYYVSSVWFNCSSKNRKTIDCKIRSAARYVLCRGKFDSISHELNYGLKWLTCKFRLRFEILKLAFLMMHGSCPDFFKDYLCTSNFTQRVTRGRSYSIHNNLIKSNWGERSFRFSASKFWLDLPQELQTCDSYIRFESLLFAYLIANQQSEFDSLDDDNCCDLSCIASVLHFLVEDDL